MFFRQGNKFKYKNYKIIGFYDQAKFISKKNTFKRCY